MKALTIGRLSSLAGVKVTTIRYYETIGLMGEPDRSEGGQRLYDADAVQRLGFIRQARELGFPIDAIRELIELQTRPDQDCASVDEIARHQLSDVRNRLRQLKALEKELQRMLRSCAGGQVGDCRVLAALGQAS
jgi:DNA-binding transcriptional MerR regulator